MTELNLEEFYALYFRYSSMTKGRGGFRKLSFSNAINAETRAISVVKDGFVQERQCTDPKFMTAFNTSALKEYTRKELLKVLDSVLGKKGLVIDPTITGPLSVVAEYSLLKVHECNPGSWSRKNLSSF
jgi:hypothetical protein